ncbi:MAG TPA: hypothetical protein VEL76_37965, partial [Gemmataceae bacterium]|nr:hypothetical protein [Gemmataceae bacterium]
AVDDKPRRQCASRLALGKVTGVPFGTNAEVSKSRLQDRQQPLAPRVCLGLTQGKEFAEDDLQRISLEVDQEEEELLLGSMQQSLATAAGGTPAGLAFDRWVGGVQPLLGPGEGRQQQLEFRDRQSGAGQELPPIALELCVGQHRAIVRRFLIPDKV